MLSVPVDAVRHYAITTLHNLLLYSEPAKQVWYPNDSQLSWKQIKIDLSVIVELSLLPPEKEIFFCVFSILTVIILAL